ncbi:MAG: RNA polymerase sigma factor [Alcanivorax sp.]|jgi:RNA polymerase sigma-70 factor (ECF subfamily)|uniref:RNA polymerase sigma factor n=1 Tax=Alcanivorax sp. TaxID=1872427 RepID=UPI002623DAAD|nr:RNA polymerase sigma factor [Alcanivorax sp.]MDF1723777.1 RNA polymerase sigma factor [Alcanivorax sp.]
MKQREFESLVGPFLPDLYRLAYRFTANSHDADDLIQNVLVKLYPRLQELKAVERLKPWLAKVLYREFVDSKRREKRWLKLVEPLDNDLDREYQAVMESTELAPEYLYGQAEQWNTISLALDTLNSDQRTLVTMHDIEGYTVTELTEILDLAPGTVKSRLHRARARLRNYLEREPEVPAERVQGNGRKR